MIAEISANRSTWLQLYDSFIGVTGLMSDTLQFVVVMRDGLAAMLLESFAPQRQTKVCRTLQRDGLAAMLLESSESHRQTEVCRTLSKCDGH
jgi:hypothetical protein